MNDAAERARAAHAFDENIVVVAGAGTGKTSLLVERVICQMVARDLDVDSFAAITFTEKAAAEMRKRLAESLAELRVLASAGTSPDEVGENTAARRAYRWLTADFSIARIAEIASQRLRDLVRAEISTIHGFCAGLLRRHPLESGVDPGFSVDTGLGFDELQRELWREFLAGEHGPSGANVKLWRRALAKLDLAELELVGRACASFELPEEAVERALPDANRVLVPFAEHLLGEIDKRLAGAPAKGPESWLDAARAPLRALREQGLAGFARELAAARFQRTRGGDENLVDRSPPGGAAFKDAEKLATKVQRFFRNVLRIDDALISDVRELTRPFVEEVRRKAPLRGVLPFGALLALARDLLLKRPELRRELGKRYRVLFLDEFQDTDPVQYEIVFLLAEDAAGPAAGDAFATRLAPGKLFIVGDPKQAIYRFRGADIAAYKQAVTHVVERNGGTELALVTNFRAVPDLLEPLEPLLRRALTAPDRASESAYPGYHPLVSGRARAGEPRIEIWTIGPPGAGGSADDARRAEAEAIGAWVAEEIAAERRRPRDVALLFRALRDIHLYARALQDRGVPCLIGRSEDLESQPAGQQLLALLRALANPADAPAVLGVLRSPFGAVPDAELARWAGRFQDRARAACWSYPDVEPPQDELPNLARAFALLRVLRARAREGAPEALLAALVEETPLVAIHASAHDGERRVTDLWVLIERLAEIAQALPGRDLAELVRVIELEERRPAPGEAEDAPDRVRLSSIHGAKGLEFPVVILPDLARPGGGGIVPSVSVALLRTGARALAISTRAALSASWIARERDEEVHIAAEAGRLFYVACTRAAERLIFVNAPRDAAPPPDAMVRQLEAWGYPVEGLAGDAPLPGVPEVRARNTLEPALARVSDRPRPLTPRREPVERAARAVARARDSARRPFTSPSGLREDAETREQALDVEPGPTVSSPDPAPFRLARALGLLLHDALERWDFRDPAALRELVRRGAQQVAGDEALSAADLERDALALVDGLLSSDLPARLARLDVLGRELPVLWRDPDGTAWNGTIDLLYRDTDGRLVVADYKTDRAPDEAARTRYRAQLAAYARGVARAFPEEPAPALELVWLRTGLAERFPLEWAP